MTTFEAADRADVFIAHAYPEQLVNLGEIRMNYAKAGSADLPALVLVPGQTESWWGYEKALAPLAEHFEVFAVDLRGQGRSTWTPGRYTLDNMGNDLARFIDIAIGRPAIVSGNSSGGVLAAWLAAYARPGQVRGVVCEDPPFFSSELIASCGHSIRQSIGPIFALSSKWLGDQWSIGDWAGMQAATLTEVPGPVLAALARMSVTAGPAAEEPPDRSGPSQNMREYDPEWARAFWTGSAGASCDHARMLSAVRSPMLLTHHYRTIDSSTGTLMGAISDQQVRRAGELVTAAGQPFEVIDMPEMAHAMHAQDPELFSSTIVEWSAKLDRTA